MCKHCENVTYRSSSTKSVHESVLWSCHCCTFWSTQTDWGGEKGAVGINMPFIASLLWMSLTLGTLWHFFASVTKSVHILHQY